METTVFLSKNEADLIRKTVVFIKEIGIILFPNFGTQNLCGTSGDVHLGGLWINRVKYCSKGEALKAKLEARNQK